MELAAIIVTGLGVLIALIFSIYQSCLMNRQMKVSLFADYTKRYQEIRLNLPKNISDKDFELAKLANDHPEQHEATMRYMIIYFDLCSEEYFLNQSKYLDKKVWLEWEKGIKYTFQMPAFKEAWEIINVNSKFYDEFAYWIDNEVLEA